MGDRVEGSGFGESESEFTVCRFGVQSRQVGFTVESWVQAQVR